MDEIRKLFAKANRASRWSIQAPPAASSSSASTASPGRRPTHGELLDQLGNVAQDRPLRIGEGFRTRVGVKVQDGCNHACTYCIVHVARGPARSTEASSVIGDCARYLDSGVKEIVLTGIDLGSYASGSMRLEHLVEELLELIDKKSGGSNVAARLRASSLEPDSVSDRFVELMSRSEGRLCRHLHLPLQSGSSKVLREMARPYTASAFADLADSLYGKIPGLSLSTDIICGFPGETDDEFEETIEMARLCRFSKIHVFPYSMRKGTPAAARGDQVPAQVKSARTARLRDLAKDLGNADLKRRDGTMELALVEGRTALTESYHEIAVPAGIPIGDLAPITLHA